MKAHQGVDVKKIGLIGHSEGGVIAPLAAVQSKDIAFIVSMAGVGIKGMDLMKTQTRTEYLREGFNEDELKRMDDFMLMMTNLSEKYTNRDSLNNAFAEAIYYWQKQQPETFLTKAGLKGPNANQTISQIASTMFSPWMRYFLNYDPATTLTKLKIPILAIDGGKDVQVDAKENLAGFNNLLTEAGNTKFKTVVFPNLNHMFQNAGTGDVKEYATIEETISPEVLDVITKWILEVTR